ncbi:MAG: hypothetical protein DI606_04500 [Sphingobium sp.]|uniref:BrnT family toxin n=1 Tax=Sphingobium sp. TaxID=1912891 RepID=UPI000DB06579|nr:BrnT family toxin [Sphingobium sp.]PZU13832.1 MAG: hypothetical protein DI606_04500 [Sphingobium sp.]
MDISYDPIKRETTLRERGLDFEDAAILFSGVYFTEIDDRQDYGEIREISIGVIRETLVLVVVWTERNGSRRIVSMRKANKNEREGYYEELERSGRSS